MPSIGVNSRDAAVTRAPSAPALHSSLSPLPWWCDAPVRWLLRAIGRRALRWHYRNITVVHAERVPPHGPRLLIGNHPNDLPDVLIGYALVPEQLRFLATMGQVGIGGASLAYRALRAIPLVRARDVRVLRAQGIDGATVNAAAADTVRQTMRSGGVVGAFPEGGVPADGMLGPFKPGVAQLALDAAPLTWVPFGVHYEDPLRFRSDVFVTIGEPRALAPGDDGRKGEANGTAAGLTEAFRSAVASLVCAGHPEIRREERARAVAIGVAMRLRHQGTHTAQALVGQAFVDEIRDSERLAIHEIVRHRTVLLADECERVGAGRASARDYATLIRALGQTHTGGPRVRAPALALPLLALPALVGALIHVPLFRVIRRRAEREAAVATDVVARTIAPGLFVVLASYVAISSAGVAIAAGAGAPIISLPVIFGVIVTLLPLVGDCAVAWLDRWNLLRLLRAARRLSAADRAAFAATVSALERVRERARSSVT
jgi:1-acyl-sn-glycerol-3-phosphate acyltransferase